MNKNDDAYAPVSLYFFIISNYVCVVSCGRKEKYQYSPENILNIANIPVPVVANSVLELFKPVLRSLNYLFSGSSPPLSIILVPSTVFFHIHSIAT